MSSQIQTGTAATSAANAAAGTVLTASVQCPTGTKAVGGGGTAAIAPAVIRRKVAVSQDGRAALTASYPSAADTWTVSAAVIVNLDSGNILTLTPYAVCAN